jgi:MoxR-like ATPase
MAQLNNVIPLGKSFSPTWQHLYERAMMELDKSKLPERIAAAHRAIVDRAEEIVGNQSDDEHYALNDALRALRLLEQVAAREKPTAKSPVQ